MKTRVAVIMPCFNDGEYVAEAVASVRAGEDFDLVIVDDASTDAKTREVLDRLAGEGHRVVRHERNQGPSAARNTGLAQTTAPYVFPLDSDDVAARGLVVVLANKLDLDPEAAVCFGDFEELRPTTRVMRAVPDHVDPFRIAYTNEMPGTVLFRRTFLEQAGGWNDPHPTIRGYEDWNLWMTLAELGLDGVHVGHGIPVFRYRLQPGRVNSAARQRHRELYASLKLSHPRLFSDLPRHRAGSDLSRGRKILYPIVYGGRPRLSSEHRIKRLLDRAGVWTLRS